MGAGGVEQRDELLLRSFIVAVIEDLSKYRARQRVTSLTSNESNKSLWVGRGWGQGGRTERRAAAKKFHCCSY